MLVICYDSFCDEVQEFVDWKNQKGIKTTLVPKSEAGSNVSSIKSYISSFYNSHDLTYVLLVGDKNQIPSQQTGSGSSSGASKTDLNCSTYSRIKASSSSTLRTRFNASILTCAETEPRCRCFRSSPSTRGSNAATESGTRIFNFKCRLFTLRNSTVTAYSESCASPVPWPVIL